MSAASGTSLNRNTAQLTGEYAPGGGGIIRKTLAFSTAVASATNQTIGVIPSNAIILAGSGIFTTTAFNGTTPTLDIGYAADSAGVADPNAYASALALPATTTFVALDEIATATAVPRSVQTTVTAAITYTNTTAGSCEVLILYANG